MPEYASLITVRKDVQNAQEFASVWGDIRTDIESFEAELTDTYAVLGEYDFLVLMSAPDRDAAYKAALAIERYGFDLQTMEIIPTEELARIVEDR